ncbi:hypothetical protein F5884DRAFT_268164 [Xylogone sp. PMI_703]|nr:hypothetical protein F5884DRAFT_268164 [Xylogone sp. PMI_703]
MRPALYLSVLLSILHLATAQDVQFVNPAPFGVEGDFSLNAVYPLGSTINVQWSPGLSESGALTMFQLNGTQFLRPFEYLAERLDPNVTSFSWTVATNKDLKFSNMFYMCLFISGQSSSSANSHYFNITSPNTGNKAGSSSSTSSATTSTTLTTSVSTSTTATTPRTSTTPSTLTVSNVPITVSSGLSSGAKAGISVGVTVAVIIGVAVGWFAYDRIRVRKQKQAMAIPTNPFPMPHQQHYQPEKWLVRNQRHQLGGESMEVHQVHELSESYYPHSQQQEQQQQW